MRGRRRRRPPRGRGGSGRAPQVDDPGRALGVDHECGGGPNSPKSSSHTLTGGIVDRGGRLLFPSFAEGTEAMLVDTRKLLDRVAKRVGWKGGGIFGTGSSVTPTGPQGFRRSIAAPRSVSTPSFANLGIGHKDDQTRVRPPREHPSSGRGSGIQGRAASGSAPRQTCCDETAKPWLGEAD